MDASKKEGGNGSPADGIRLALKEAKDLAHSLEGTGTTRLLVKAGDLQIEIQREVVAVAALPAAVSAGASQAPSMAAGTVPIVSPLVGVFYRAGSPGAKPLVQVGDTVERGQKVAIIEAMKVMNDVTSDCRGVVVEILVEDATPVTYEQRLMLVDTSGGAAKT
ncbi:MAG: acetyl-CoA carboxylase biotin carboxyl carrier protein [Acidobacteriia bacterium]|nr:acetyl-CoA carboxylase biotin carboxyl carrier protein [Terriglobia bacterium]